MPVAGAGIEPGTYGGYHEQAEYDDAYAALKQLVADEPALKQKLHITRSVLARCKLWLDQLPNNAVLEVVEVEANNADREAVSAQLKTAEDELAPCKHSPLGPPTSSSASVPTCGIWRGPRSAVSVRVSGYGSSGPARAGTAAARAPRGGIVGL
jgi:hypothetical protein